MTLTLPDTDAAIDEASATNSASAAAGAQVVLQSVRRPTPWARTAQAQVNVAYQHSNTGWAALLLGTETLSSDSTDVAKASFLAAGHNALQLDAPVVLNPLFIDKPWGREIWFSGIEERGETTVTQGNVTLTLSSYLSLAPQRLVQRALPLLLKILDPNAQPENGNLYVETHNTKHEVYVVTHVDATAWPNRAGAIRLGMNQAKRADYGNDEAFRAAYLSAVQAYEELRRAIDDNSTPGSRTEVAAEENRLRKQMESFTGHVPLRVGDVVQVGPHMPHSLQHGVQAFEFQTPVFERNIISFDQQVLTQPHWDSAYAIANMSLDGPAAPKLTLHSHTDGARIETIVDFDDFDVLRITLSNQGAGIEPSLFKHFNSYCMLAVIEGSIQLASGAGNIELSASQSATHASRAALIPASAENPRAECLGTNATVLLARPKPHTAGTIPVS